MEFKIASQKIWKVEPQIKVEDAESKALEKKLDAFGTLNRLTGFFQKPNPLDFELLYKEIRYQPFWHVATRAHYVFDREVHYQLDNIKDEVKSATVLGQDYPVTNGHLHLPATEHCQIDLSRERFIDGLSGTNTPGLQSYLQKGLTEINDDKLDDDFGKGAIIVPPQARVSGIMREMLADMIKGIQADQIFEEEIELSALDLYYRPIYAFKFLWKSKKKEGILEIDAVTGAASSGTRTFSEYLGKALDRDFLFDLGSDVAGMIVPGGSIAVKMAKKALDLKEK